MYLGEKMLRTHWVTFEWWKVKGVIILEASACFQVSESCESLWFTYLRTFMFAQVQEDKNNENRHQTID